MTAYTLLDCDNRSITPHKNTHIFPFNLTPSFTIQKLYRVIHGFVVADEDHCIVSADVFVRGWIRNCFAVPYYRNDGRAGHRADIQVAYCFTDVRVIVDNKIRLRDTRREYFVQT